MRKLTNVTTVFAAVALVCALCGCGAKTNDVAPTTTATDAVADISSAFVGEHVRSYDQSSLTIKEAADGKYDVDISIVRLCQLEAGVGTLEGSEMVFTAQDPNESEIQGKIYVEADDTLTVEITNSTWEYLPNGEKLTEFGK